MSAKEHRPRRSFAGLENTVLNGVFLNPMRNFLFLIASAREGGNSELLARRAAETLPEDVSQTWLRLDDLSLPPFQDIRHSVGVYPEPVGHARTLLEATLACTDLVFVAPLYWYGLPASAKRYLDEWSAWMRVPEFQGEKLGFKARMQDKTMWAVAASSGDLEEATPLFRTLQLSAEYMHMRWGGFVLGNGSKPGDVLNDAPALEAATGLFSES
jgi:NAD(P)H-dependent FMN reductase